MRAPILGLVASAFAIILTGACSRATPAATAAPDASTVATAGEHDDSASEPKLCEHEVPSELCTKCNPDLIEVYKATDDWCDEHGLPESHCRECNPKLTFDAPKQPADWCREHAVPESKCTKCHPKLVAKFVAAGDYCREHGFPQSVCPICDPELVKAAGVEAPTYPEPGTLVQLASPETARDVGVRTVQVSKRPYARRLDVVGEVQFNRNRLAQVSARGEALIEEVRVDVGDEVRQGQVLAVLTSAGVGAEHGKLASAEIRVRTESAAVERERSLVEDGLRARRHLDDAIARLAEAQADLAAAQAGLAAAGVRSGGRGGRYQLTAPFAGTVVSRNAVIGKSAVANEPLFEIADLSTMWVHLDVPEADAPLVAPGQSVTLNFDVPGLAPIDAKIARVAASVDPRTRTVGARVELENPEHRLKAGAFVRARLQLTRPSQVLVVPREAIQTAEGHSIAFVKKRENVFEPVRVVLGAELDGVFEVLSGLEEGDAVVTTGAFLMKTELLKDSIGAGCCD